MDESRNDVYTYRGHDVWIVRLAEGTVTYEVGRVSIPCNRLDTFKHLQNVRQVARKRYRQVLSLM